MSRERSRWRAAADALVGWYEQQGRDLPWRRTRDPYAIWVSEVMLQQTRVATVERAWARFLERFPTATDLAAAGDDELVRAWSGLGYYRRARQLREAARAICEEHGATVPQDPECFGALPGVGAYTKGAVLSIAYGTALPAIDGNVERVLSRFEAHDGDPKKRPAQELFRRIVACMHESVAPATLNQALMELGALVCVPTRPRCDACPIRASCTAHAQGRTTELPRKRPRAAPVALVRERLWHVHEGQVLCRRVPSGEVNEGQLCLPGPPLTGEKAPELEAVLREAHRVSAPELGPVLGRFRHGITRYRIEVVLRGSRMSRSSLERCDGLEWRSPSDAAAPWTTVARKAFRVLLPGS